MPRVLIQLNVNGVVRQIFVSYLLRTLLISRGTDFGTEGWRGLLIDKTEVRVQCAGVCKWPTAISRTDNIIRASVSPTVLRCGETGTVVMGLTDRKRPKMVKLSARRRMAVASMSRSLRAYSVSLSV
jgi:hypothetical protein